MEGQKQQEMLSKLYTLRAGISAVAVEKDKADMIAKNYKAMRTYRSQKIVAKEKEIEGLRKQITTSEETGIDYRIRACEEAIRKSRVEKQQLESNNYSYEMKENNKFFVWLFINFMLTALCIIGSIAIFVWHVLNGFLFLATPAFGLAALISWGIFFYKWHEGDIGYSSIKTKKKWNALGVKYEIKQQEKLQNQLAQLKQEKVNMQHLIQQKENECDEFRESIRQEEATEQKKANAKIRICALSGDAVYSGLQSEYRTFVDERDWENLDYLIYIIETGRAESMKEALQLVDRERSTDRIVQAVQNASASLCNTFVDGMRRMGTLVTKCFAELSQRVDSLGRDIRFQSEQLSERMEVVNGYVAKLTDEVALGNALQAKANENSIKIMQDVRTMREHSDYANWCFQQAEQQFMQAATDGRRTKSGFYLPN